MRGVAEGKIPLAKTVADEAYLCLGCRACETACPSGVQFGSLIEHTRAEVSEAGLRPGFAAKVERFALRKVVGKRPVLRSLVALLAAGQRLFLDRVIAGLLPPALRDAHALLPKIPPFRERMRLPAFSPARGKRRGRVAFFEGCVMPELFGRVNRATVAVLAQNGFDVIVPPGQGCCGALHAHAGDPEAAHELAEHNLVAFGGEAVDAIISNSAGCGAAMKETGDWLGERAEPFASKTRDILEFLDEVGLRPPTRRLPLRVCYDDPCHLIHAQRVADAPRRVLAAIPGLEIVPHRDPGRCCGAAGIYNLTHPEMSAAVLEPKIASLAEAAPDVIATGNPGCLMQIRAGSRQAGLDAEVLHPVELLERAYARGESPTA
jgi:glycolate oxidase iron-sulfur subunit